MKRFWRLLFASKPYVCACGKAYRTDIEQGRCVWKHALAVDE